MLNSSNQQWLLIHARTCIQSALGHQISTSVPIPVPCQEKGGCFVTLTKTADKSLRGCIGTFDFERQLYQNVADMAISAATRDPRFPPIISSELSELHLEISVLSPPQPNSSDAIEIGQHGIIIEAGLNKGVLLPQVASEYGWNTLEFLENTCRKAGLKPNAWQSPDTKLYTFSAQIFGEA